MRPLFLVSAIALMLAPLPIRAEDTAAPAPAPAPAAGEILPAISVAPANVHPLADRILASGQIGPVEVTLQ